ncbi:MAG: class I SAM-dependent methyltransferase [Mycobacterium sp.]
MARTDDDTWDLATSVGATATMVATARAVATRRNDPLVNDPIADPLVRAVGIAPFVRVLDGREGEAAAEGVELLIDAIAVRSRFYDDFFADATAAGVRQAVILAAGLDARAYRLRWPPGTTVFEVDQPEVVAFKSRVLAEHGFSPAAARRAVGIDLRDDWPAALRAHGYDPGVPAAWIAEGLLVYLPPDAQDRLFEDVTAVSAPGSRIATEYLPDGGAGLAARTATMSAQWADQGLDLDLGELFYSGSRRSVVEHLGELGWQVTTRTRPEMFAAYQRPFPAGLEALRNSLCVTAIRKDAP